MSSWFPARHKGSWRKMNIWQKAWHWALGRGPEEFYERVKNDVEVQALILACFAPYRHVRFDAMIELCWPQAPLTGLEHYEVAMRLADAVDDLCRSRAIQTASRLDGVWYMLAVDGWLKVTRQKQLTG